MTTRARHTSPAYQRRDRGGRGRCGRSVGRADQDSSWRNAQRRSIRSEISGDVERRDRDRASLSSGNRSREDHISQGRSHEIRDGMKSTNTTAPASTPIRAAPPPPPQVLWSELVAKTQLETQRAPESTAKDQTESGQPPAFENSRGVLRIPPSSIPGDGTRKGADEWTTVPKNVIVGKKNSTGKTKKRFPQPSTPSPAKSNRPRPEPIMLDLGELLSNPTPSPPKSQKAVTSSAKHFTPKRLALGKKPTSELSPHEFALLKHARVENPNPVAGDGLVVRRRKERQTPKKKKPSALKKVILKERTENAEKNLVSCNEGDINDGASEQREKSCCDTLTVSSALQEVSVSETDNDTLPKADCDVMLVTAQACELNENADSKRVGQRVNINPAAPKLPTPAIREYVDMIISAELKAALIDLLKDLKRFQDRVKVHSPDRYKSKRRFTMGIREVHRDAKLKRLKCVVVAPNIEPVQRTGGLDKMIEEIIGFMTEQKGLLVYGVSRNRIGKELGILAKPSVIGIHDVSGAEEKFKEVKRLAEQGRKEIALIDVWIAENNLNIFGDPIDKKYENGKNPNVNQKTGAVEERYHWIYRKHPDKPWIAWDEVKHKSTKRGRSLKSPEKQSLVLISGDPPNDPL